MFYRAYRAGATLLAGTVLMSGSAARAARPPQVRDDLTARLDAFVDQRVAADSFSGVVLVARNGRVVYQRAAGLAERERGLTMGADTKLQIASVTKFLTQIAIRQLDQAGKLSLADTVGTFLPDYPNATVRRQVTVEQLLRHRSGVGSFWNATFAARHAEIRSVDDYRRLFQNDSLLFAPGTSETYSNGGYVLLGAIIERVSGMPYHDYMREHVFRPAGMTGTMPFDRRVPRPNAAVGYTDRPLDGPMLGDRRLAGPDVRPGYEPPSGARPAGTRPDDRPPMGPPDEAPNAPGGGGLRRLGPNGRVLGPDAAGGPRHPTTGAQPGMSSPAGDDYSTAGDLLKLAGALVSHRLLDSAHTAAVLGPRYAAGGECRASGGAPGVNAELSIYPSGDVVVVLSNYDPPAATAVAQYIRALLAPGAPGAPAR